MKRGLVTIALVTACVAAATICSGAGRDVIPTSKGDLAVTRLGHASLMFEYDGKVIHVDPFGQMADYSKLPKADLLLITHEHHDHADPAAVKQIRTDKTAVVLSESCAKKIDDGKIMHNGDVATVSGFKIEAVPAYNIKHQRASGQPFHPKGRGNGYILTFGDIRVYVAGDTENTPEMKALTDIDVAFLPCNLPYTMSAAMVADAATAFKPEILYPYHHALGKTDVEKLPGLLKNVKGVELRMSAK